VLGARQGMEHLWLTPSMAPSCSKEGTPITALNERERTEEEEELYFPSKLPHISAAPPFAASAPISASEARWTPCRESTSPLSVSLSRSLPRALSLSRSVSPPPPT